MHLWNSTLISSELSLRRIGETRIIMVFRLLYTNCTCKGTLRLEVSKHAHSNSNKGCIKLQNNQVSKLQLRSVIIVVNDQAQNQKLNPN